MSHVQCPKCGSREHFEGYGVAAGGVGSYTHCECGELLEYQPDLGEAGEDGTIGKYIADVMRQRDTAIAALDEAVGLLRDLYADHREIERLQARGDEPIGRVAAFLSRAVNSD